ncbi:mannosyl-oligosaccharide 1,2-alpha-mannosidase IB-like isoform X5 [Apis florea]|uniref:mannosyl-oligosaccharide 1,2-alpha-mannosidase IB-like isoform X4 n=1 Tax=Apis florea TaxID=7463 RepID=UPI0012FF142F|nr:mannosyl-oligosaccharide 1,2-alpha-mannosidase IB-like isoform X4 [Apis florea]XP_031776129.1 mannosyl-oligosaccharide 1,2-alpha-mannosidase IB-like isoform X5 [Apis florea]
MRLMQRLAISGLLSVILIVLLTGTFVTRRDLANVVERGAAPEERGNEQQQQQQQANPPAWVQSNVIPGQDEAKPPLEDKDRWADSRQRQSEPSAVGPPPLPVPGPYVIKPPNPPLDDVTNQRREKIKEMMKHGWDNYVRYAWGKNELRPISKRGHSASIFGASNMGATIVDGLDTLYIMGLHDEFKQGRDWIAENLDFDILYNAITTMDDRIEIFGSAFIVMYHLMIAFYNNHYGQLIIDSSLDIFNELYASTWYRIPLKAQKLLLFMILRSSMGCELGLSGLFTPSYAGFTSKE